MDLNIKFEYNAITEGGAELKPMFGRGLVGLNNLGNYCYMSSILQARIYRPLLRLPFSHFFSSCPCNFCYHSFALRAVPS